MANNNNKKRKRKIVRIEDIIRDRKDFVINPKIGMSEIRAKYANRKLDIPLEDKLKSGAKSRNICISCHNHATKLVYLSIKGACMIERYCSSCFEKVVDVSKMEMKPLDNSLLENIIIKPSSGQCITKEDWPDNVKKWQRF